MSGQQAVANSQQGEKQDTPSNLPEGSESSPESTRHITAEQYNRVDKNRREVQKLYDALTKKHKDVESVHISLQSNYDSALERISLLEQEVDNPYDDVSLKAAVAKFRKEQIDFKNLQANIVKQKEENDRRAAELQEIIEKGNEEGKHKVAERYAAKYGVSVDELIDCKDESEMKAYILDNLDASKIANAETVEEPEAEKLERPVLPGIGAGGSKATFTSSEIDSMDVKSFAQHREAVLKALKEGKIK